MEHPGSKKIKTIFYKQKVDRNRKSLKKLYVVFSMSNIDRPNQKKETKKIYIVMGIIIVLSALPILFLSYQEPFNAYKLYLEFICFFISSIGGFLIGFGIRPLLFLGRESYRS